MRLHALRTPLALALATLTLPAFSEARSKVLKGENVGDTNPPGDGPISVSGGKFAAKIARAS